VAQRAGLHRLVERLVDGGGIPDRKPRQQSCPVTAEARHAFGEGGAQLVGPAELPRRRCLHLGRGRGEDEVGGAVPGSVATTVPVTVTIAPMPIGSSGTPSKTRTGTCTMDVAGSPSAPATAMTSASKRPSSAALVTTARVVSGRPLSDATTSGAGCRAGNTGRGDGYRHKTPTPGAE
jgi:hypothetical protein